MMSRIPIALLVLTAAACVPIDGNTPEPCIPEQHCVREATGGVHCEDGYEWEDEFDDSNYVCVPLGGDPDGGSLEPDAGASDGGA